MDRPAIWPVLLLGVLRQLRVLHRRLDELNATNDEQTGLAVGMAAPDFTLPQVGGGAITLGDLRGSPVLLGFVSPGCPPCTQLAQELDGLLNVALDGAGVVRSVGVVSSRERVERFLARATESPGGESARSVLAGARA